MESERKSGSKPEGCHTTELDEPEQPVQAPEEPVGAVSSWGHLDPLEERFASWIGQQDRPFPSHEWLEYRSRARCDKMSQWAVLVTGPPGTGKTDAVHLLARHVQKTFPECDMREVEGRKLVDLILKGHGGLRQTSVAILNIDTDVTEWRLCKAAQQSQIPLIFVCDDDAVTARNDLVQKCLWLEVRHEPHNVEPALRRMTQRNGLNMPEACMSIAIACRHDVRKTINAAQLMGQRSSSRELPTADLSASAACHHLMLPSIAMDVSDVLELLEQDGEEFCRSLQRQYLTSCGESFETLDRCVFAAEAMALGDVAECAASHTAWGEDTSDSTTNGCYLGAVPALRKQRCHHSAQACPMESPQMVQVSAALIATLSAETGLLKGRLGQSLDRSQSRGADERRTSNAESEVEGEFVRRDGHGKNRLEASTNEEDGWTLAEEHEDIQDDVAFVDVDWNKNAAVFEQKDLLDTVLALDAGDVVPNDEVMKEAETTTVEGKAVDLPEVDDDRKDEATLHDVVTEEVLVPAMGAPQTGWRVDRFPQGPGRMRLVSTPLWSSRPPTCESELWLIIGKAAQREMRAKWHADDPDAFAAQEERRPSWRRAKRGGVVACGVPGPLVDGSGELHGAGFAGDGHACLPRALAVRAINDDPAVSSEGGLLA